MKFSRGQYTAKVVDNLPLCREHYKLVLHLPEFPVSYPGQFVQLACDDPVEESPEKNWGEDEPIRLSGTEVVQREAFLRRPFSLAGRKDVSDGVELSIIHRIVGIGTGWMSRLGAGQRLSLIGPLGNRFREPGDKQIALLVGGGVGIPPMLYWAESLKGREAVAFCGALSRDLLPLTILGNESLNHRSIESLKSPHPGPLPGYRERGEEITPAMRIGEFADWGIPSVISTDDGSVGVRGFVTQVLEGYLDTMEKDVSAVIYTCGPEVMMRRVADIAIGRGIECQVAVERAMACGMGTCQSCVIRVKKADASKPPLPGSEWCYRLACTDGPIFSASDLLW